ncbi:MAG: hypothetical protein AAF788_01235 [Pseudomonadota bacterium]
MTNHPISLEGTRHAKEAGTALCLHNVSVALRRRENCDLVVGFASSPILLRTHNPIGARLSFKDLGLTDDEALSLGVSMASERALETARLMISYLKDEGFSGQQIKRELQDIGVHLPTELLSS